LSSINAKYLARLLLSNNQQRTNRFAEHKRLRDELKEAKSQLSECKLVDRDITFFVDSPQMAWNKEISGLLSCCG
jgi:hypothetical protein